MLVCFLVKVCEFQGILNRQRMLQLGCIKVIQKFKFFRCICLRTYHISLRVDVQLNPSSFNIQYFTLANVCISEEPIAYKSACLASYCQIHIISTVCQESALHCKCDSSTNTTVLLWVQMFHKLLCDEASLTV